jgi:hypothetical protein
MQESNISHEQYSEISSKFADIYDSYGLTYSQILDVLINNMLGVTAYMVHKNEVAEYGVLATVSKGIELNDKSKAIVCEIKLDLIKPETAEEGEIVCQD